jgi:thymidylate synthase (FAD)
MKIINPGYEILTPINTDDILRLIEKAGRTCYRSEDKISKYSHIDLIKNLIRRGHESVLEHFNISILFICNRGFSHELVRHRIASYSQESTRYCNYSQEKFGKEITVIRPWWSRSLDGIKEYLKWDKHIATTGAGYDIWKALMKKSELSYFDMLGQGYGPQEARGVLPIDLKTEIIITTNLREWRYILKLRTSVAAHPSMQELMKPLLKELQERLPVIFNDL